ncbi:hypothetical protein ACVWWO_006598 [Bradyrhizobium sp. F1.13.1]
MSTTEAVCSKLCTRLIARCTTGSKLCTPRLARLTPESRIASTMSEVSVRGSISTAISADGSTKNDCRIAAINSAKASGAMIVGVPPPKWMCSTLMRRPIVSDTCAISLRSVRR